MKNRKQKVGQPKKIRVGVEEGESYSASMNNGRNGSGHTKISTNCTIHSNAVLQSKNEKTVKSRKNCKETLRERAQEVQIPQPSSKSYRKTKKYDLSIKIKDHNITKGEESCRQYCVVDQNFAPVSDSELQKMLQDMLIKTASTTSTNNVFNSRCQDSKGKLRKRSMSSERSAETLWKQVPKLDKAVSNMHCRTECIETGIEAKIQCCQIGLQYSERPSPQIQQVKKVQISPVKQQFPDDHKSKQESLSELLFKLQFSHLGDQSSFTHLNSLQKQHFTQLLQTVIQKIKPKQQSPAKTYLKPICFQSVPFEKQPRVAQKLMEQQLIFQQLQQKIELREYIQLSAIEDMTDYSIGNKINTSLVSILNFLGHLFCYVQVHYSEQFVYMVKKRYGLSYRDKYKRITRTIPMPVSWDCNLKVLDESVFEDLINDGEDEDMTYNDNQLFHFRSIFDALNEHLDEYRPFYIGNGEQFPWNFKMPIFMNEYSIDEDSLQIIFRQARQKIMEWSLNLCGLHVDLPQGLPEKNPLQAKNREKEEKLVAKWLSEQSFEKDEIELYSTQALHEVSESIVKWLLGQFSSELNLFFN